jgi:hypothetical protein
MPRDKNFRLDEPYTFVAAVPVCNPAASSGVGMFVLLCFTAMPASPVPPALHDFAGASFRLIR